MTNLPFTLVALILASIFFPISIFSQEENASKEKLIFETNSIIVKERELNIMGDAEEKILRELLRNMKESRIELIHNAEIETALEGANSYMVTYKFLELIDEAISRYRYLEKPDNYLSIIKNLEKKKRIIENRLELIVNNQYVHYDIQEISKKWIKGFHVYHDNDSFMFTPKNKDRDYTGGFRFEFMTDLFKMRLFKYLGDGPSFLSYQSILIGGEGYTPYIRYDEEELVERKVHFEIDQETNFLTSASKDSIQEYLTENQQLSDRPFASFQYVGRAKYRLHNSGKFRMESITKFGKIGGNIGKNIQSVIHQDFYTSSIKVLNWERQIANGGRFALNIEHKLDLSYVSKNSLFFDERKNRTITDHKFLKNINIYSPFELAFGTVNTHIGTGIGISNKSFMETSGINDLNLVYFKDLKYLKRLWSNTFLSFEYNYRNVIHNSMLEGIGFINPFEDDPLDDEKLTIYKLGKNDVTRHLHRIKWQVGFRLKKITFYYRQVRFLNREFRKQGAKANYKEFETPNFYGYGTIGLHFLM